MKDLTNETFSFWTVLQETDKQNGKRMWLCKCKCKKEFIVAEGNLKSGKSTKCKFCANTKENLFERHRLYSTWKTMKTRCTNSNAKSYKDYGGRGITICPEWLMSFPNFLRDMEESFVEGLTLDRKNNNGNYCKENCKWSTKEEQLSNQRKSIKLEFKGQIFTEAQLARLTKVSRSTIQARRNKGASVEEMVYGFKRI